MSARLRRWLRHGLAVLAITYVAVGIGFRLMETQLLYHPSPRPPEECNFPPGVELAMIGPERGLLTRTGARRLLVFYHGNGESACNWRFLGPNHLAPLGYDTLVMEYPGYAGDPRKPGSDTILNAARIAHGWAAARYDEVAVMGYSIGSGPASYHAGLGGVSKLLLFAPFDSMYRLLVGKGFWYPRRLLANDYDNIAALRELPPGTVIVHGARDRLIPPSHAVALHDAIRSRGGDVSMIVRPDLGHGGLFSGADFDALLAQELGG